MRKIFLIVRLSALAWSAAMLTAIDSVGIISQGDVELDNSAKQVYSNILWAAFSSFLTEAVIKKKDEKDDSESFKN